MSKQRVQASSLRRENRTSAVRRRARCQRDFDGGLVSSFTGSWPPLIDFSWHPRATSCDYTIGLNAKYSGAFLVMYAAQSTPISRPDVVSSVSEHVTHAQPCAPWIAWCEVQFRDRFVLCGQGLSDANLNALVRLDSSPLPSSCRIDVDGLDEMGRCSSLISSVRPSGESHSPPLRIPVTEAMATTPSKMTAR